MRETSSWCDLGLAVLADERPALAVTLDDLTVLDVPAGLDAELGDRGALVDLHDASVDAEAGQRLDDQGGAGGVIGLGDLVGGRSRQEHIHGRQGPAEGGGGEGCRLALLVFLPAHRQLHLAGGAGRRLLLEGRLDLEALDWLALRRQPGGRDVLRVLVYGRPGRKGELDGGDDAGEDAAGDAPTPNRGGDDGPVPGAGPEAAGPGDGDEREHRAEPGQDAEGGAGEEVADVAAGSHGREGDAAEV